MSDEAFGPEDREQIEFAAVKALEVDGLRSDLSLASEAIRLLQGMVKDLVNAVDSAVPNFDASEYESDLDRVDQLAHLFL